VTTSSIAFSIIFSPLTSLFLVFILLSIGQTGSSWSVTFSEHDHLPHIIWRFLTTAVDGVALNNPTCHLSSTEVLCFVTNLNIVKWFLWSSETYKLKYGDMSLLHVVFINRTSCWLLYGNNKHVSFEL
jgi:hypothetical protein